MAILFDTDIPEGQDQVNLCSENHNFSLRKVA